MLAPANTACQFLLNVNIYHVVLVLFFIHPSGIIIFIFRVSLSLFFVFFLLIYLIQILISYFLGGLNELQNHMQRQDI